MRRRSFITGAGLGAAALVGGSEAAGAQPRATGDLYYLLREYDMRLVGDGAVMDAYLRDAFLPAAKRLGLGPIGVFDGWYGEQSLTGKYVLAAGASLELLAELDRHLAADPVYAKAAQPFLQAPVQRAPFYRLSSSLIRAMPGLPRMVVPTGLAGLKSRIFELRTYEQPTYAAHERKVSMFQEGEVRILDASGFHGIMYGVNIVGERLPHLTYMWVYRDLAERQRAEEAFFANPEQAAFFGLPQFAGIPSAISNAILRPTAYSEL